MASEFRTDVFRSAEAADLIRGVLADTVALAERDQDRIAEVLGQS